MLFDKIGYYLGSFTLVFCSSRASLPNLLLRDSILLSLSPSLSVRLSSTSIRKPIEDIQDRWVISEASSSSSQVRYHPHSLTVNIVRNPKSKVQRSILCPLQFSPRHHVIFRCPLIYSRSPLILHPSPYFLNLIYIIYFHSFSLFRNLLLLSFLSSPSTISYYTI